MENFKRGVVGKLFIDALIMHYTPRMRLWNFLLRDAQTIMDPALPWSSNFGPLTDVINRVPVIRRVFLLFGKSTRVMFADRFLPSKRSSINGAQEKSKRLPSRHPVCDGTILYVLYIYIYTYWQRYYYDFSCALRVRSFFRTRIIRRHGQTKLFIF